MPPGPPMGPKSSAQVSHMTLLANFKSSCGKEQDGMKVPFKQQHSEAVPTWLNKEFS